MAFHRGRLPLLPSIAELEEKWGIEYNPDAVGISKRSSSRNPVPIERDYLLSFPLPQPIGGSGQSGTSLFSPPYYGYSSSAVQANKSFPVSSASYVSGNNCDRRDYLSVSAGPGVIENERSVATQKEGLGIEMGNGNFRNSYLGFHFEEERNKTSRSQSGSQKIREKKVYSCEYCGRKLSSKTNLTRHTKVVHLKEQTFKCPECPSSFLYSCQLKLHHRTVHQKLRPYPCPNAKCNRRFGTAGHLKEHIQLVHERRRDHICPILLPGGQACAKRCRTKGHLNLHIKLTHYNERPFSCSCGKVFGYRSHARRCERSHS